MEAIAEILYGILHHPLTTQIGVPLFMMGAVLIMWGTIQGYINERQRDKERAEMIARLTAEREARMAHLPE